MLISEIARRQKFRTGIPAPRPVLAGKAAYCLKRGFLKFWARFSDRLRPRLSH